MSLWKQTILALFFSSFLAVATFGEDLRTWVDSTGKHKIVARFSELDGQSVILQKEDGSTLTVPLRKLSKADQQVAKELSQPPIAMPTEEVADQDSPDQDIAIQKLSEDFYADLRTEERSVAGSLLSTAGQEANQGANSPLAALPKPDAGSRSVRVGKANIEGDTAKIPVVVRAGGKSHPTQLHLKNEEGKWRVFALSATLGEDEKTINFEVAPPAPVPGEPVAGPLEGLVGKPIEFTGMNLAGQPFDIKVLKGKVVLIDFWATWCGPCLAEMPNIRANLEKYNKSGFEVVGLSVDQNIEALTDYVNDEKPPWTILADNHPDNSVSMAARFGITGIPAFVLVGPDGNVVAVNCRGARLRRVVKTVRFLAKTVPVSPQ